MLVVVTMLLRVEYCRTLFIFCLVSDGRLMFRRPELTKVVVGEVVVVVTVAAADVLVVTVEEVMLLSLF